MVNNSKTTTVSRSRKVRTPDSARSDFSSTALSLVDSLSDRIAILDQDGMIVAVNTAWQKFADSLQQPFEAVANKSTYVGASNLVIGLSPSDAGLVYESIKSVVRGDIDQFATEVVCQAHYDQWVRIKVSKFLERGQMRVVAAHEDISEKKLAEIELQGSKDRLTLAMSAGNLGTYYRNLVTGETTSSLTARRQYGFDDNEEIVFSDVINILHPDDRQRVGSAIQTAIARHTDYHSEFRVIWKDGSEHWIASFGRPVYSEANNPVGFIGVTKDVTEEKRAQQDILQNQERLVLALAAANLGIFDRKLNDNTYAEITDTCKTHCGLPGSNDITFTDVMQAIHANDQERVHAAGRRLLHEHEPYDIEYRVVLPDGSTRWISTKANVILDPLGDAHRIVGVTQDITARKNSEEAMANLGEYNRMILESTAEGIYGINLNGDCTFINRAGADLLGFTEEEAIGRNMHYLVHHSKRDGSNYPITDGPIFKVFQAGLPCYEETEVLWRKDGTYFDAEYSSYPIIGSDGIVGAVVSFSDITHRRQIEQEKERLLLEAQRQADSDPLTGVLNHRAFHDKLEIEVARAKRDGLSCAIVLLDLDNFKFFNDAYNHIAGDEVLRLVARRLTSNYRPTDMIARFGGDEFALLLPGIEFETLGEIEDKILNELDRLYYDPQDGGTRIPITASIGAALLSDDVSDRHELLKLADARMQWFKTGGIVEAHAESIRLLASKRIEGFSMLNALVTAVDNKDRYTRHHSEDVMSYSLMIAKELGVDDEIQQTISIAALIHDVGKIGIPDSVLRKPAKLTEEEFNAVKMHPTMGLIMVQAVPGLEATHDAVQYHHERWDGQGYPVGLRGMEIPLTARIVAVADAFSAMTTDRPYREGMKFEIALRLLHEGSGTQWDPECVLAFENVMSKYYSVTMSS